MVAGPPKAAVGSRFQTAPAVVVKSHGGERTGWGIMSAHSTTNAVEGAVCVRPAGAKNRKTGVETGAGTPGP